MGHAFGPFDQPQHQIYISRNEQGLIQTADCLHQLALRDHGVHEVGMAEVVVPRESRARHDGAQIRRVLARDDLVRVKQIRRAEMGRQSGHSVRLQPVVVVHEENMLRRRQRHRLVGGRRDTQALSMSVQTDLAAHFGGGGQDRLDRRRCGTVVDADQFPTPVALGEHAGKRFFQPGGSHVMDRHQDAENWRLHRIRGSDHGRRTRQPPLQTAGRAKIQRRARQIPGIVRPPDADDARQTSGGQQRPDLEPEACLGRR